MSTTTTAAAAAAAAQLPPDARIPALRLALKEWEYAFAAAHAGRRATRDEIKAHPAIAAQYKEYNRLTGKLAPQASKESLRPPVPPRSPKRKAPAIPDKSPKRRCSTRTPETNRFFAHLPPMDMYSPADGESDDEGAHSQDYVRPTPRRDGRALGFFDLLEQDSPCKTNPPSPTKSRQPLSTTAANLTTPSAARFLKPETPLTGRHLRLQRTPTSDGKRFLLDKYVTPSKRTAAAPATGAAPLEDPGSTTPAFLRRQQPALSLVPKDDDEVAASPSARKRKRSMAPLTSGPRRRILGRSLSSMIRDIREREEDRLDEEMDLLNEVEAEEPSAALGPDGAHDSESDAAADAQPARPWKKRGAKRQTRRVVLKPVLHLRKERQGDDKEPDKETLLRDSLSPGDDGPADPSSTPVVAREDGDADYSATDDDDGDNGPNAARPSKARKVEADKKKPNVVQKAVRKVSEAAHANFRRLKIKSRGQGKPKGRFGRR